jgi:hypothetical protein
MPTRIAVGGSLLAAIAVAGAWPSLFRGPEPADVPLARVELSGGPSSDRGFDGRFSAVPMSLQSGSTPQPSARRPVKPAALVTCEQFWIEVQPIFDMLPHMEKSDIHKLGYFCPADFNKDDRVDESDLLLFAQTWTDEASPLFNWCDVNADGFVDAADAVEFMSQFNDGPRDGERIKELRSMIC